MNFVKTINKVIPLSIIVVALIILATFLLRSPIEWARSVPQEVVDELAATLTYPYTIKDGKIMYVNEVLEGIDIATFEIISTKGYARDKNSVYLASSKIPGADPESFEYLPDIYEDYPWGYARDKNSIYLNGNKLEDSDPKTFELIRKDLTYGRDKDHVYLGMYLIKGADPATFQIVSVYTYSKDKKSVYFRTDVIPNSDPATFESVINLKGQVFYYKDKNNVYDPTLGVIAGANPLTFRSLGSRYFRDDRLVYYSTTSLLTADLQTFIPIGDSYSKDKNYLYREGEIIFDLSKGENPFGLAARHILDITPKGDVVIDYVINTYYDLTLYYGNYSDYNIFSIEKKDKHSFFDEFFQGLKRSTYDLAEFVPFRLAFVAPNSPAYSQDFPNPAGAEIGGDVVGRKLIDSNTMLVYASYGYQEYLGASATLCKGAGESIDKFIFKKVNGEWKIWEIEERIDSWTTTNEGSTEEECKPINQDKVEKYKIG